MDPEQTFLRVHARLSGMLAQLLTPKLRTALEHLSLVVAIVMLGLLAIMHVNFVAQPGCAKELSSEELVEAQLLQIKITGYGLQLHNTLDQKHEAHMEFVGSPETEYQINDKIREVREAAETKVLVKDKSLTRSSDAIRNMWTELGDGPLAPGPIKLWERFMTFGGTVLGRLKWISGNTWQIFDCSSGACERNWSSYSLIHTKIRNRLKTTQLEKLVYCRANLRLLRKLKTLAGTMQRIAGRELLTVRSKDESHKSSSKGLYAALVSWLEQRSEAFMPLYFYGVEKGYLMLPEGAKSRHFIRTVNISISAQNICFGNRWQQLLINGFVGYDTILMNSLLNARGEGFLFNFQTKEMYDLNYLNESSGLPNTFQGYIVAKSGVLIMSLFVFFTTTTSVSFILRETQARMLKFTVQLQYHARHGLPTFRLIFIHIIESLVFVPIMIGILFFLFEFYDDQLLAFMVLCLVWLCELFTMISVRTPMSMQYYPRFFLLYFMLFHIYFFSYEYGFSYLAFTTTAAFMQHLILYFWNHFEVPALHQFMRTQALLQQQPGLHITSAVITSTFHVARFRPGFMTTNINNFDTSDGNLRYSPTHNEAQFNSSGGSDVMMRSTNFQSPEAMNENPNLDGGGREGSENQDMNGPFLQPGVAILPPPPPSLLASFGSVLLWILGGHENPLSALSNFRDTREQRSNRADNPMNLLSAQNFPQGAWHSASDAFERLRRRGGRSMPEGGHDGMT